MVGVKKAKLHIVVHKTTNGTTQTNLPAVVDNDFLVHFCLL